MKLKRHFHFITVSIIAASTSIIASTGIHKAAAGGGGGGGGATPVSSPSSSTSSSSSSAAAAAAASIEDNNNSSYSSRQQKLQRQLKHNIHHVQQQHYDHHQSTTSRKNPLTKPHPPHPPHPPPPSAAAATAATFHNNLEGNHNIQVEMKRQQTQNIHHQHQHQEKGKSGILPPPPLPPPPPPPPHTFSSQSVSSSLPNNNEKEKDDETVSHEKNREYTQIMEQSELQKYEEGENGAKEEKEEEEKEEKDYEDDVAEGGEEKIEWIIPKQRHGKEEQQWDEMEKRRLHNSNNNDGDGDGDDNSCSNQKQQQEQQSSLAQYDPYHQPQYQRQKQQQQQQQFQHPTHQPIAPRNYNYNRIPIHHQQLQQQQQQQYQIMRQRQMNPQQGQQQQHHMRTPPPPPQHHRHHPQQWHQQHQNALIPRQPSQHHPHQRQNQFTPHQILQKIPKPPTNLNLQKNTSQIASHLSSNVSSIFRKTLFNMESSVTNIKNTLKDNVKEVVHSGLFGVGGTGGAPTSSNEASFEWEDDRRKTVFENRKKRLLGSYGDDDNGESKDKVGSNPLQEYLDSGGQMMQQQQQDQGRQQDGAASGSGLKRENIIQWDESVFSDGDEDIPERRPIEGVIEQGGIADGVVSGTLSSSPDNIDQPTNDIEISVDIVNTIGDGGDNDDDGTQHSQSPYAYPTSSGESKKKQDYQDGSSIGSSSSSSTIHHDEVDPATYFISKPTTSSTSSLSSSSRKERSIDASYNTYGQKTKDHSYSFDEFDIDPSANKFSQILNTMTSSLPRVPRIKSPFSRLRRKSSSSGMDDSGWSDDEDWEERKNKIVKSSLKQQQTKGRSSSVSSIAGGEDGTMQHLVEVHDLLERMSKSSYIARKDTVNLLSSTDIKKISSFGKEKAIFDMMTVFFGIVVFQELRNFFGISMMSQLSVPTKISEVLDLIQTTFSISTLNFNDLLDSWAIYAFVGIMLSQLSLTILNNQVLSEARKLSKTVDDNAQTTQTYLQLVSGLSLKNVIPSILGSAASKQFIAASEIARLRDFVFITLVIILTTTVSIIKPIASSIIASVTDLAFLDVWNWPVEWEKLGTSIQQILIPLSETIKSLLLKEMNEVVNNPISIASTALLCLTLLLVCHIPTLYKGSSSKLNVHIETDPNHPHNQESRRKDAIFNAGNSGISRVQLQSVDNAVNNIVHSYKEIKGQGSWIEDDVISYRSFFLQKLGLTLLTGSLLISPLILTLLVGDIKNDFTKEMILLMYMYAIVKNAVEQGLALLNYAPAVNAFGKQLVSVSHELQSATKRRTSHNLQVSATASPAKGINVSDLWVAHVAKRAWACRSANLDCQSGEVILVLGDVSSGKTRLLTAIAEAIVSPPKQSRSTIIARGKIKVGGLELNQWDKPMLLRKMGVHLNDARSLSTFAQLNSGSSLVNILQPIDKDIPRSLRDRVFNNAIDLASKISGVSSTLIPKLQSKLSTRITAYDDEVSKTTDFQTLSPSEWYLIHLTKVIAQAIASNDSPLASPNSVSKCLVGSILLLDDAGTFMDEVEEAQFVKALKSSGAASILTSKRWALGRLVDKIVVLRDGNVVESGTHAELVARGSKHSLYAKKWAQITSV